MASVARIQMAVLNHDGVYGEIPEAQIGISMNWIFAPSISGLIEARWKRKITACKCRKYDPPASGEETGWRRRAVRPNFVARDVRALPAVEHQDDSFEDNEHDRGGGLSRVAIRNAAVEDVENQALRKKKTRVWNSLMASISTARE